MSPPVAQPPALQPTTVVLEVLLRMASLRPNLTVQPIEHDLFFVVRCMRVYGARLRSSKCARWFAASC